MPSHYLRRNETTRTPVRVVCFDTEAHVEHSPVGSRQWFRLAVASFDVRRTTARAKERTEWGEFTDKAALWEWITAKTAKNHATWGYAHNLEYDLTVSGGWEILEELGWQLAARAAGGSAPWSRWRNDGRTLVLADLHGWAKRPLATVGEWLGLPKAKMPKPDDPEAKWLRYCKRDTEVLRAAVLNLMEWVDTEDLGNWSLSGAGQAWRVFRHRHMDRELLVHDDADASRMERAASFGGRREVFRVGQWRDTPILNLDFQNHYMTVAGRSRLPIKLAGIVDGAEPERVAGWAESLGVIAEVDVSTEVPAVPVRTPVGIIYPVGRFTTTLAWPELSLLAELGAELRYRRVALYRSGAVLAGWAEWLASRLHGDGAETDQLRAHVLKGWSRELVGKFGQRSHRLVRIADHQGHVQPGELYFPEAGRDPVELVNRPDGLYLPDRDQPGENAVPAVFAYITSAARVALWRALETVGWSNVVSCDTDGMLALGADLNATLVTAPGGALTGSGDAWAVGSTWRAADSSRFPGVLAVKAMHTQVEVRTPEAMILDGRPRVAGLPRSASRLGPWEFQGETWPKADWQRAHRNGADYVTVVRPHIVHADYTRRRVHDDGSTSPWRFQLIEGRNVIPELGLPG